MTEEEPALSRLWLSVIYLWTSTSLADDMPGVSHDFVINQLRTYCKACHAIGNQRFITSTDNEEVWKYIFENNAPVSAKLWAKGIIKVLSWPSEEPPSTESRMDDGKNWMPIGSKRFDLAKARHENIPLRKVLVHKLGSELNP